MDWLKSWRILQEAANDWMEDNAARMGAALAFYSVLSLAPLLMIALGLAGLVFDEADAVDRQHLVVRPGRLSATAHTVEHRPDDVPDLTPAFAAVLPERARMLRAQHRCRA